MTCSLECTVTPSQRGRPCSSAYLPSTTRRSVPSRAYRDEAKHTKADGVGTKWQMYTVVATVDLWTWRLLPDVRQSHCQRLRSSVTRPCDIVPTTAATPFGRRRARDRWARSAFGTHWNAVECSGCINCVQNFFFSYCCNGTS